MQLAFYKNTKTIFGFLIREKQYWFDHLDWHSARYSHVELVFSDSMAFSSSEEDKGVRFKKIRFDHKHWDFVDIPMSDRDERKLRKWCEAQVENRYAWFGIFFAQIFNFNLHKKGNYFCSQICVRALQEVKRLCTANSLFTSPGELHKIVTNGK